MRAVIQRVTSASVTVNGNPDNPDGTPRAIGKGIVILLGISTEDTLDMVPKLAQKCAELRIFEDDEGKLNRSAVDVGGEALVVSNFTLYGDTAHGRRPSFIRAAKQPLSGQCYEKFLFCMASCGLQGVQHGEFGADMQLSLVNDGPVTIVIDTDEWEAKHKG